MAPKQYLARLLTNPGLGFKINLSDHMREVFIIDSVRTPIGKYGGSLSMVRPDDLLAHVIKELLKRNP